MRALQSGPLYRGLLDVVVSAKRAQIDDALRKLKREGLVELAPEIGFLTYRLVPLSPERRIGLYLAIARKMRALGPDARGIRHAAVRQAWDARREIS